MIDAALSHVTDAVALRAMLRDMHDNLRGDAENKLASVLQALLDEVEKRC